VFTIWKWGFGVRVLGFWFWLEISSPHLITSLTGLAWLITALCFFGVFLWVLVFGFFLLPFVFVTA
jgi:hypothetical protein